MGVSVATVHTRLRRALVKLRDDLRRRDRRGWSAGLLAVAGVPSGGGALLVPDFAFPPGGERRLVVALTPGEVIAGRVIDHDGAPAVGIRLRIRAVEVLAWIPNHAALARTDADGRFEISGLLPGKHRIDMRRGKTDSGRPPRKTPVVDAGDRTVEIRLRPRAALQIRLVDAESGELIEGETKVYFVEGGKSSFAHWNQNGRILDLEPPRGGPLRVRVALLGYHPAETEEVRIEPGEGKRHYRNLPPGRVVAEVRRADGRRSEKTVEIRSRATAELNFPRD
jgi:hypothetical protein